MPVGITKIREVSEYITVGFVGSMSKYFVDIGVPLLRGQNIKPYKLDLANLKFIPTEIHKKWKKSSLEAGDVVIVRVGYPGTACVIPEGLGDLNAASLVIVRPDPEKINPQYLCYVINSPWGKATIQGMLVGAAQQVFNTNTAAELGIPLPSLSIQQKIASTLSAYDDLIENNTRRIRILEEMAKSLYREWFIHFRFPGHERVKLVNSPRGKIPEGWESAKLSEIARVNASSIKRGEDPEEINYIDIASVSMGYIEKTETLTFIDAPGRARRKVKHGDIIWSTVRPNRQSFSIILDPLPNLIVSTGFSVITALDVPFTYLYQATTTEEFVSYLSNHAKGSAYPAVTAADFMNSNVLLPSRAILEAYNKIVEPLFILKQNKLNKNANLRHTRDLLLPKLISGEVEASNLREVAI